MGTHAKHFAIILLLAVVLAGAALAYRGSLLGSDTTFIPSPVETGFLTLAQDWDHSGTPLRILTAEAVNSIDPPAWRDWDDVFEDFKDVPRTRALFRLSTSLSVQTQLGEEEVVFDMVLTLTGWRIERVRPGP